MLTDVLGPVVLCSDNTAHLQSSGYCKPKTLLEQDLRLNEMAANGSNSSGCDLNDSYKYPIYSAIYSVVFIIGLGANSVALFVFFRLMNRRKESTVYLTNLALADLFFVLTLPFRSIYYMRGADWPFGDIMCRITSYAFYVNLYCSIFFLTGLSVFRYLAIVHPIRSRNAVTPRCAAYTSGGIWVFVALISLPFLLSGTNTKNGRQRCFEPSKKASFQMLEAMNYMALVVGLMVPFAIIIYCYICIFSVLNKMESRKKKDILTRQKAMRMIIIVLVVFGVCFIPYHVQRTVYIHISFYHYSKCQLRLAIQKSVVASICFTTINSCLDPVIYFFLGENFREKLFKFVRNYGQGSSFRSRSSLQSRQDSSGSRNSGGDVQLQGAGGSKDKNTSKHEVSNYMEQQSLSSSAGHTSPVLVTGGDC
uniref:cysteinyl leukotriene receptor 1-like isoform X2 n=1 Tax=Myxine glutinosa TaxID=7769 RepID=UPI00358F0C0F